ncbi:methyl-accepting chemotaxis protein [Aurantibacillus circumpalustris]|uniref:methyl-accepting chemotaxis protein n=1 Tax=Aurantibacillus circumpalustris TaxID=3036359 RepID=UPI00295B9BA6|nr:methyl-accepting chemotaxis protein [Aurantibacillus circumpalustris]
MLKQQTTIKLKLLVFATSTILTMCILGIFFYRTIGRIDQNRNISSEFTSVWVKTLELRKSEKDFLLRENTNMNFFETGESSYAKKLDQTVLEINTLITELKQSDIVRENAIDIDRIGNLLKQYQENFKKIVAAKLKRGELDFGIIGQMRKAVRSVEEEVTSDPNVTIQILTLRRHEKDYLLRKDQKYVDAHAKVVQSLLENNSLPTTLKEKLLTYQKTFNSVVEIDAAIGLTQTQGLEGEIRATVHKVEPAIDEITVTLNDILEKDNAQSSAILMIIIAVGITIAVLISFFLIRSISSSLNYAVETVGRIASGDLNFEITVKSKDEIGQLLEKMSVMTSKLKEIISAIRNASLNIATASTQMNSSAQQMSEGATEQASSVEEISSSMEEMAANIQQNTNNSKQTEKIASSAAKDVSESNEAVTKTVSSMKTIANKISIIGEISRQTNLLALNAAVEAARAGEHGKGFAVVAAEVRKLAERSQIAATEINEVSAVSVDIAQNSGELLNNVVPNIQKTSDLIQEITASSIEQNAGAEQVNNAIQQLNQVVQENAATAEEMAAGAEELNEQADSLKEIISFFKTGDNDKDQLTSSKIIRHTPKKAGLRTFTTTKSENNLTKTHSKNVQLDLQETSDANYEKF